MALTGTCGQIGMVLVYVFEAGCQFYHLIN